MATFVSGNPSGFRLTKRSGRRVALGPDVESIRQGCAGSCSPLWSHEMCVCVSSDVHIWRALQNSVAEAENPSLTRSCSRIRSSFRWKSCIMCRRSCPTASTTRSRCDSCSPCCTSLPDSFVQLDRKKHIGNDVCVVVFKDRTNDGEWRAAAVCSRQDGGDWCSHFSFVGVFEQDAASGKYKPTAPNLPVPIRTFTSQFNHTFIVVRLRVRESCSLFAYRQPPRSRRGCSATLLRIVQRTIRLGEEEEREKKKRTEEGKRSEKKRREKSE
jgi:hypothetical protein